MSRTRALLKEEIPNTVIGEIAAYLHSVCGIPGCNTVFHLEDAQKVIEIIVEYNNKKKQETK